MFRFFETRITPDPKGEPTTPPRKLLPFLLHYSRPLLPWLLAMSVLTGVISALEITFFDYMGQLVDWMGSTGRDSTGDDQPPDRRAPRRQQAGDRHPEQ